MRAIRNLRPTIIVDYCAGCIEYAVAVYDQSDLDTYGISGSI